MSLKRFIDRLKENPDNDKSGYSSKLISKRRKEADLAKYIKRSAEIYHGLGPKDMRRLAYDCAVKYKLKYPASWDEKEMAGKEWLNAFLKRNNRLSIRRPESTSPSRATSFNRNNVSGFYDKLYTILSRNELYR